MLTIGLLKIPRLASSCLNVELLDFLGTVSEFVCFAFDLLWFFSKVLSNWWGWWGGIDDSGGGIPSKMLHLNYALEYVRNECVRWSESKELFHWTNLY